MSNIKNYKYDWIWKKDAGSNFATVKYQPMKEHETVSVFNTKSYNPIKQERVGARKGKKTISYDSGRKNSVYGDMNGIGKFEVDVLRYPSSVQSFKRERGLHPTQKPVALLEYLIRTYTNEGEIVLDNCMGSGSTGVACINTNRKFIGIELDEKYYDISCKRIKDAIRDKKQLLFIESNKEKLNWNDIQKDIYDKEFLSYRPLLKSIMSTKNKKYKPKRNKK
jgi:site-specific DNA-methyltransferase (adenine-specific)